MGIQNTEIDLLNNRYIEVMVNEVVDGVVARSAHIKLRKCKD